MSTGCKLIHDPLCAISAQISNSRHASGYYYYGVMEVSCGISFYLTSYGGTVHRRRGAKMRFNFSFLRSSLLWRTET